MSQDEAVSKKKDKKTQRDAERRKKGKKRKHEEIEGQEQVEQTDEFQDDFVPLGAGKDTQDTLDTEVAHSKTNPLKKKVDPVTEDSQQDDDVVSTAVVHNNPKKRRKKNAANGEEGQQDKGKHRFILFVGNLPYSTIDASLEAHFQKIKPFTLRHRTDPKTNKSKGFAFLEFEQYDRMKTCLKLYHHSMFDPAKATNTEVDGEPVYEVGKKVKGARRINVELTAGGGGTKEGRKEKIKAKNVRLDEQRRRRAEHERKEKEKSEKKVARANGVAPTDKKEEVSGSAGNEDDTGGMHPSRLARMSR